MSKILKMMPKAAAEKNGTQPRAPEEKTVIPVMFPPYEDETLDSWLSRLAAANGMGMQRFRNAYMSRECRYVLDKRDYAVFYINGLSWLEKMILEFPSADRLVLRHTLYPLLAERDLQSGVHLSDIARNVQALLYNSGSSRDVTARHRTYQRRACIKCMDADAGNGRDPYLRLWHQFPGVTVCAVHGTPLAQVDRPLVGGMKGTYCTDIGTDAVSFAQKVYDAYRKEPVFEPVNTASVGGITPISRHGMFLYARCDACGSVFLMTIWATSMGWGCPECGEKQYNG